MSLTIERGYVWADGALICMARVMLATGSWATQAALSGITRTVTDLSTGLVVSGHDAAAETVANVVFDTFQTTRPWSKDATGYNFRTTVAGTAFPNADRVYQVEFWFTPASGSRFPIVIQATPQVTYG